MELRASDPQLMYNLRQDFNRTYLDFIQLLDEDYHQVCGCTCAGRGGVPRRVVFDGNSISYNAATVNLAKPWAPGAGSPASPVLRREDRQIVSGLSRVQRAMIRALVHKGQV